MNMPISHDNQALIDQARQALPVCIEHCSCPDRWHVLWAALKSAGLLTAVHGQQAFLADLLPRCVKPAPHVLIAGAADTGSLDVLCSALADPQARYSVIDLCEAPLQLVRQRARDAQLPVRTARLALDAAAADEPWDLVFIHYTLGFMSAGQRQRFLQQLRRGLAPGGTVLCAVREKQPPASPPADPALAQQQRAADWVRHIEPRLEQVCDGRAELLAPLRQWLQAYALSLMLREDTMPAFSTVADEFGAAGFALLESHRNPGQVSYTTRDLTPAGSITAWIGVFAVDPAA